MTHLSIRKLGLLATAIVVGAVSLLSGKPTSRPRAPISREARITPNASPRPFRVDDTVRTALVDYAKRPASSVALDPSGVEHGKTAMRAVVSRSMDLKSAHRRISMRFDRTSYTQSARDVPIHLGDRRDTVTHSRAGVVSVVYRESTSGHVMTFDKLGKEQAVPTGDGLAGNDAGTQARAFMVGNGLIGESSTDVIAQPEVRARHVDQEGGNDFVVQQDIVLRRSFDGKPVINSAATVSVLPEPGHEIVGVKVANWIPAQPDARREIKPAYDEPSARTLAVKLETQLADVLAQELGADARGAIVRSVEESWFSSERDGLIPALVFAVELREGRTAAIAMTPYHDSAQIWQQGKRSRMPAVEPEMAE